MKLLDIAFKDMRQSYRSLTGIMFMFVVPILVTALFAFLFGGVGEDAGFTLPQTSLVLVNLDSGELPAMPAPADATSSATANNSSRDSTAHGPAMTTKWSPPSVRPESKVIVLRKEGWRQADGKPEDDRRHPPDGQVRLKAAVFAGKTDGFQLRFDGGLQLQHCRPIGLAASYAHPKNVRFSPVGKCAGLSAGERKRRCSCAGIFQR